MLQLRGLTICREEKTSDSWLERFERLKQFEVGLNVWLHKGGLGIPISSLKLKTTLSHRILKQLKTQRACIKDLVDDLSARLDQQPEKFDRI